jgi:hypothetical protein
MTFKYQPGNPPDKELRAWLGDELRRISNAIGAAEFVQLTPVDVAPAKPSKGMVVWAVGSNWDPGAGQGMYVYNESGTWDKVN